MGKFFCLQQQKRHLKSKRDLQDVEDTSPNRCAASFKVLVVSAQFEGKPLLQRHRWETKAS
uniref:Uncharacterized protein n=1 Tax=Oryzias sinensis TaxID=183150 RepID=A0A8C7WZ48_9TELE